MGMIAQSKEPSYVVESSVQTFGNRGAVSTGAVRLFHSLTARQYRFSPQPKHKPLVPMVDIFNFPCALRSNEEYRPLIESARLALLEGSFRSA